MGRKYVEALSKVDRTKFYSIEEAIKLVKDTSITKFDSTVEVVLKLNVNPKKSDQQLRGSLLLPNGTGKTKKVLVIADGEAAEAAKTVGADYVGADELIEKIEKDNWFDFDVIVAIPSMMIKLGKIGRILGPKGLMPNPKTGTVTTNPAKVVEDIKKGMIEYKTDTYGNVHSIIGKSSFTEDKLIENLKYMVTTINKARPISVKNEFITTIVISSTMGPGIKLDLNSFDI